LAVVPIANGILEEARSVEELEVTVEETRKVVN
jgi:hypothetical protein